MVAIAAAVAALAAVGGSIYSGVQQTRAQKKAEHLQNQAQREATSRALATEREQRMEQERVSAKKPDISALMTAEQQRALSGPTATMLTGTGGTSGQQQRTTSLLGE
jgi:uncharacterized protein HemX